MTKTTIRSTNLGIRFSLAVFICIALLFSTTSVHAAKMKKFKHVRLSTAYSSGHWFYESLDVLAKEANKLSDGTLNVVIYPSSQLYKVSEIPSMLQRGTLEIGTVNPGYTLGKQKKQWGRFLFSYFNDADHYVRWMGMSDAGQEIAEDDMIEHGMVPIAEFFLLSDWAILSTKPVKTVADLKGIKIRMPGPFYNPLVQVHGMAPVTVSITETHMAMGRGTVDAVFTTPGAMAMFKFYEVGKYFNMMRGVQGGTYGICASKKLWDKLHPKQKKALLKAGYLATLHSFRVGMKAEKEDIKKILTHAEDHTFNDVEHAKFLGKIRPLVKPKILDRFAGPEIGDRALQGAAETKNIDKNWEEAVKIYYEKKLKRWGVENI